MRKVMIVDDEALVRIGLQSIIDWESRGYRIGGVFKNGEEAVRAAAEEKFDIVLTDIRMPGMDGFALIRELKRLDPSLRFIILSSYSDFEYTRQAIQAGVNDYISKYEMEPEELLRVLDALSANGERSGVPETAGEAGSLDDERAAWLTRTKENRDARLSEHCPALLERLGRWGGEARWVVLMPLPRTSGYSQTERKAMALQTEEIFSRLDGLEYFGEQDGLLHGACALREGEQDDSIRLRQIAEELTAAWAKNLNVALVAGAGNSVTFDRLGQSRKDAERAAQMCFYDGAGIYLAEHVVLREMAEQERLELYRQAKNKIDFLHFEQLGDEIRRRIGDPAARLLPAEWQRVGEMIATHLMNLMIERYESDPESLRDRFGAAWPLNEAFRKLGTQAEFVGMLQEMLARAQEAASSLHASRGWVAKAKAFVESRYGEPLRLEDAAEHVSFSPSHFSQRFRQETGEAFSDYLTRIRIREAIRLYNETELSTEEIAARVGYLNANYFIKVFKRMTGQTVKQFKSRS